MKNQVFFQDKIKANRKLLKAHFKASTIHMWEYGKRAPSLPNAKRLASILGIAISRIPYLVPAKRNNP